MSNFRAAIDLGTNTARLLLGSVDTGKIERHHVSRRITRLGGGFSREKGISREAADRTVAAMKDFAATLAEFKVTALRAVATSAVRDAVNRAAFCREVRTASGIDLEVISGETEGRLTLLGVGSGLDVVPDTMLVFDVGGGSTEYTISKGDEILFSKSLPLGVVRLTEGKGTVAAMEEKIERELSALRTEMQSLGFLGCTQNATLLGTAGTATTLAAIDIGLADYDYSKVNNYILSKEAIDGILRRLLPLAPSERLRKITGLEAGREDLIIAGTLLTLKTIELFGFSTMKVSDFGLLEGLMLDS